MAQPKTTVIDGELRLVQPTATVLDIVPAEVGSIVTYAGALVPRSEFARVPVPEGFETNLSPMNKGRAPGSPASAAAPCADLLAG